MSPPPYLTCHHHDHHSFPQKQEAQGRRKPQERVERTAPALLLYLKRPSQDFAPETHAGLLCQVSSPGPELSPGTGLS